MNGLIHELKPARLASILLRVALAFVFAYAATASFIEPDAWVGYLPQFLRSMIPAAILLPGFSLTEFAVAAWLLSGRKLQWASGFAALMLAGIVVFNFGAMDIVFRDVALVVTALALCVLAQEEHYES